MSRFISSRLSNLVPYTPGEQPKNKQLIKLNTNENPYPQSPKVLEAILAEDRQRLYPDPEAGEAVR
ncbi:MAG: histidinol-phosphate transaminase, partial [Anaerovoracaceae bacterium]